MCFMDYIAAFTVLGIGGIFRSRIQKPGPALALGAAAALTARYVCHVISGYILFSGWAEWFFTQEGFPAWGGQLVAELSPELLGLVYSLVYNGMYMLPELILTCVAAFFIAKVPQVVKKV